MHTHFGERPSHVRRFEMVETQSLRRRMEAAIEALIASLDALDGDTDREADAADDEDGADLEVVCEDEGCDGGDRESDMAEYGVADGDALADPELGFGGCRLAFWGTGETVAAAMLQRRGIAR
jgi:hypothetical protein